MRDRNAKAEGPHGFWIRNRSQLVVDDSSCQYVVAGDEFAEFPRLVFAPPAPADVPIVGPIGDYVISKSHQPMLLNCVPQPQFGGNPTVKPFPDGQIGGGHLGTPVTK